MPGRFAVRGRTSGHGVRRSDIRADKGLEDEYPAGRCEKDLTYSAELQQSAARKLKGENGPRRLPTYFRGKRSETAPEP